MLPARRSSHYFMESHHHPPRLETCTRSELVQRKEKNTQMLNNQFLVNTLPDKGKKLRDTNRQIDLLLQDGRTLRGDAITPENTTNDVDSPLTQKIESMSIMTPRERIRKQSIQLANAQARGSNYMTTSMLRPRRLSATSPPSTSMFFDRSLHNTQKPKVRMMPLDESMKLQTTQLQFVRSTPPSPVKETPPYSPTNTSTNVSSLSRTGSDMQLDTDMESSQFPFSDFTDDDYMDDITRYERYHDDDDNDNDDDDEGEEWAYGEPIYLDDRRL